MIAGDIFGMSASTLNPLILNILIKGDVFDIEDKFWIETKETFINLSRFALTEN